MAFKRKFKKRKGNGGGSKALRKINKMSSWLSAPEVKFQTQSYAQVATATTGALIYADIPAHGTTGTTRVGDKIKIVGFDYKFLFYSIDQDATASVDDQFRVTFFRYGTVNGQTSPVGIGDLYADASSGTIACLSGLHPGHTNVMRRFQPKNPIVVYKDVRGEIHPYSVDSTGATPNYGTSKSSKMVSCRRFFNRPIEVSLTANNGTLADVLDSWIFALVVGSSVDVWYDATATLYYIDT